MARTAEAVTAGGPFTVSQLRGNSEKDNAEASASPAPRRPAVGPTPGQPFRFTQLLGIPNSGSIRRETAIAALCLTAMLGSLARGAMALKIRALLAGKPLPIWHRPEIAQLFTNGLRSRSNPSSPRVQIGICSRSAARLPRIIARCHRTIGTGSLFA